MVEAVTQGTCTNCDKNDDNYNVVARNHDMPDEDSESGTATITRELSCDCGAEASVTISNDGITAEGSITHESATWNEESEE